MPQNNLTSLVPMPQNSGEIVLYQPNNDISLEVRLDKETVWLTQDQMALLFGRDRTVIGRHIRNVFHEGELDESLVCAKFALPKKYGRRNGYTQEAEVVIYNLDVIISVGYRVKSQQGTFFRQWATSVLKDYLLRGYSLNQQILYVEQRIDRRLQEHTEQIHELQDKVDFFVRTNVPPVEQVFFDGEFFAARALFEKLIKTAVKRVVIIDGYVDAATFEMLDVRKVGVTADIYSASEYATLRDSHNTTIGKEPVATHKWTNASHDRWLIIDDLLYHCGHSLKDTGKKLSAVMLMGITPETILKAII